MRFALRAFGLKRPTTRTVRPPEAGCRGCLASARLDDDRRFLTICRPERFSLIRSPVRPAAEKRAHYDGGGQFQRKGSPSLLVPGRFDIQYL